MNDGERREVAVELALPQPEEEDGVNKQSTTILEQVLNHYSKQTNPSFLLLIYQIKSKYCIN